MATTGDSPTGQPAPERPDVGTLSYAAAGSELDAIIDEFETGVIDVDRLVGQLERATDIVDELDRRLRRTRMRVEELVPRLEAIGRGEGSDGADDPFSDADPSERSSGETPPGLF